MDFGKWAVDSPNKTREPPKEVKKTGKLKITPASRSSPLIQHSKYNGYDLTVNSFVGCMVGCKFCFVRFFIKDSTHEWGSFVRLRQFS